MDFFGIGQAILGVLHVYFTGARRTGRTTTLIASVKNGDRICFTNTREAKRVEKLCKEREITIDCVVVPPDSPELLFKRGTSKGRTIFDHTWVEQYYLFAIARAQQDIATLERETSRFGEAHRQTQQKAREWEP